MKDQNKALVALILVYIVEVLFVIYAHATGWSEDSINAILLSWWGADRGHRSLSGTKSQSQRERFFCETVTVLCLTDEGLEGEHPRGVNWTVPKFPVSNKPVRCSQVYTAVSHPIPHQSNPGER